MIRHLRWTVPAATLALLASCATSGPPPAATGTRTMTAARAALPPEYRLFYDALEDEGDWVLIEPHGFVFRPDVNFVAWHPYERGFWVPSDVYGWVWISTEPFGWATYHYGRWMYDDYQGWVWIPGLDWAPAWVSWEMSDEYVGWAPLPPDHGFGSPPPDRVWRWAPIGALGSTDLATHVVTRSQAGARLAGARPVRNVAHSDGVRYNAGPPLALVERRTGPLPRVRIEGESPLRDEPDRGARIAAMRAAADRAAREAGMLARTGGPLPARVALVRPALAAPDSAAARPRPARGRSAAPADSARR